MATTDRVEITRLDTEHPDLTARLEVRPPLDPAYPDRDLRLTWTLAALERTCIELRAAGAWDDSKINLGYQRVDCEILAQPNGDVLPWGWVPAHGAPPAKPEVTGRIGERRLALAIVGLLVVELLARIAGWVL